MGKHYPSYPGDVQDGDEPSFSPNKTQHSLLGTERGTDYTRRIETDADGSLHVNISSTSALESLLHSGSTGPIASATPTTISTYNAVGDRIIYKITVSGEAAADFTLRKNLSTIDIKRTNIDLNAVFSFPHGMALASGDTLDVRVTHESTGNLRTFDMFVFGA